MKEFTPTPTILYEDESIIVINKPRGMLTHFNHRNKEQNHLQSDHYQKTNAEKLNSLSVAEFIKDKINYLNATDVSAHPSSERLGIVHRLDKDTSGLMICSKNLPVEQKLKKQFQKRTVTKKYLALVEGLLYQATATINLPIAVDSQNYLKRRVDFHQNIKNSKEAITHYQVKERFSKHTLLDLQIVTGRTHQIRVHLQSIGYPIVGDKLYNRKKPSSQSGIISKELFLTAYHLSFYHPLTKKMLKFTINLPNFFSEELKKLRQK